MSASQEKRDQVRARRKEAIALRLAGVDLQTIADRLGYASRGHVHLDLQRAREESRVELDVGVEELRHLQVDRLNRLLASGWGKAVKGDLKAVDTCSRLVQQLSKLQGLEAPTRVQLEARIELDQRLTAEVIIAVIDDLGITGPQRVQALEMAQQKLMLISGKTESGEDEVI